MICTPDTIAIDPVTELLQRALVRLRYLTLHNDAPWPGWVYVVEEQAGALRPSIDLVPWEIALYQADLPPAAVRRALQLDPPAPFCVRCVVVPTRGRAVPTVVDLVWPWPFNEAAA